MQETDLEIRLMGEGNGIPPFSARECHQTLSLMPQNILKRTVNGELICINADFPQKFHSLIHCKDKLTPTFGNLKRGTILNVKCIQSITQIVPSERISFDLMREGRDIHVFKNNGTLWDVAQNPTKSISIIQGFPGGFVTFKPILNMMVKTYTVETDEWGLSMGWSLELEEV